MRHMNPSPTQWAVAGLGTLAVVLGLRSAAAKRRRLAKKKKKPEPEPAPPVEIPEDYFSGYLAPGATLGAAPSVLADIQTPIYISGEDLGWEIALRTAEGDILLVPEVELGEGADDISRLVLNLYSGIVPTLHEMNLNLLANEGYTDPHLVASRNLFQLLSKINWEGELPDGTPEDLVYRGAVTLAVVGQQSLQNKGIL